MKPKISIFALTAAFVALAVTGWEQFTHAMTQKQRRGWFIAFSAVVLLALAWALRPWVVSWFM